MDQLPKNRYEEMRRHATVLEEEPRGEKVLLTRDGRIAKLFRPKPGWSSSKAWPYALRFAGNARRLKRRGIQAPDVQDVYDCPWMDAHLVVYPFIEGHSIRQIAARNLQTDQVLPDLAAFIADLHSRGVYFRALHFGNVIRKADGTFALIDITPVTMLPLALGAYWRARNFRRLFSYREDRLIIERFGYRRFFDAYLQASRLGAPARRRFLSHVDRLYYHRKALSAKAEPPDP